LKIENAQLRSQLSAQLDLNHRLRFGLSSVLRIVSGHCELTANHLNASIEKLTDRLSFLTVSVKTLTICNQSKSQNLRHLNAELATQKASISQILNAFRSEMFKARSVCLDEIRKRNVVPQRSWEKEKRDQRVRLLASGCDDVMRCIVTQLGIEEMIQPTMELVESPKGFGNQISRICSVTEEGIGRLYDEIRSLKSRLIGLRGMLSPEVSEVVKKILRTITGLSDQMQAEHETLLERLT
jgi:hypothetical protein